MRQLILLFVVSLAASAFAAEPQSLALATDVPRFKMSLSTGSRQHSVLFDRRLPSRDPAVVIPHLQAFTSDNSFNDVLRVLGEPYGDVGGARHHASFELADGDCIVVLTDFAGPLSKITHWRHGVAEAARVLFDAAPGGLTTRSSEQPPAVSLLRTFTLDLAGACR